MTYQPTPEQEEEIRKAFLDCATSKVATIEWWNKYVVGEVESWDDLTLRAYDFRRGYIARAVSKGEWKRHAQPS